jgi:hypothetical protein
VTEVATKPAAPSEAGVLAGELAKSFGQMVQLYEKHYSLSREEAVRRAAEPLPDGGERTMTVPPDQVSWFDLDGMNFGPATEQPKLSRRSTIVPGSGRSSWRFGRNWRPIGGRATASSASY